jgi:DNA-binding transcriptional MerR regulator
MNKPSIQIPRRQAGYIRKEAFEITQIPARTIQYYTDRKFVTPEVAAPTGRGTTRRYSLKNLVELSFVKELSEHGYTLEKIEGIMDVVRGSLAEYWYKSLDIAKVTDLFLVLLSPSTKRIEVEQVQLCREKDIYIEKLIKKRSFSVIGLEGIILRILKA